MSGQEAPTGAQTRGGEDGYLLLGAIVAIALVMIALSVAAVKVSFELRREREVESARRAQQYVRAIREYYLKFGRYPGSVEQLENTNNIRFLRQKYVDPLTGKPDYRLIILGQNKTQPTGFFGEPLGGLPGSGTGAGTSTSGAQANPGGAGGIGTNSMGGIGGAAGASSGIGGNTATVGFGGGSVAGTQTGEQGTATTQSGATQSVGSNSSSSTTGTGPPGSNSGPIMGVGSSANGNAILAVNGQTTYETWEFLYDPRVERLRQAGQLNQGTQSASGAANGAGLGISSPAGATGAAGAGANGNGTGGNTSLGTPVNGTPPSQP